MSRTPYILAAAAAAGLLSTFGATARAAAQGPTNETVAAAAGSAMERAEALRAEAAALETRQENWRRIRALHEKAAHVAPEEDLGRIFDLKLAGDIAFYMNDLEAAERLLVRAAATARDLGDVYQAAHLYLDAAIVAGQRGNGEYARELLRRGKCLAQSPLLEPPLCDCLRERVARLEGAIGDG